ncbi:hypothetical protein HDU87_008308 [Geranomyces variabilis]|uniref:Origin recognition complex subunit 6 n=1 Tax=Geranomyces variabilis TaxID=109894 RepID=A0AAD5TD28_9FUNG|nr:hypothetical protein HDU87_008308 [Geranomyces variabilis]
MSSDIHAAAEKLALALPANVATKAAEYFRLAQTRNAAKTLGKHLSCLPYLCIQLACETLQHPFSAVQCMTAVKVPLGPYSTALAGTRASLQLPPPVVTLDLLGVRLGATQMVADAQNLLAAFRENYGKELSSVQQRAFAWDGPDLVAAVFFVCCSAVVKLAKRDVAVFAHNVTQFNKLVKIVEAHCKEQIAELKTAHSKPAPGTPSRTRKRKASEAVADDDDDDDEPGAEDVSGDDNDEKQSATPVPSTPTGRRKSPRQKAPALRTPQTPVPAAKRPRMGASAAAATPSLSRRLAAAAAAAAAASAAATATAPDTPTGRSTTARDDSSANLAAPIFFEPNYAGVNIMISQTDIRDTKKFRDYSAWKTEMLRSIPADIVAKYTPSVAEV